MNRRSDSGGTDDSDEENLSSQPRKLRRLPGRSRQLVDTSDDERSGAGEVGGQPLIPAASAKPKAQGRSNGAQADGTGSSSSDESVEDSDSDSDARASSPSSSSSGLSSPSPSPSSSSSSREPPAKRRIRRREPRAKRAVYYGNADYGDEDETDQDDVPPEYRVVVDGTIRLPGQEEKRKAKKASHKPVPKVPFCEACVRMDRPAEMLQCKQCKGRFHLECVDLAKRPKTSWLCPDCVKWQTEVQAILTWHKPDPLPPKRFEEEAWMQHEYYVKWSGYPHMADEWVPGRWLFRVARPRLQPFVRSHPDPLPVEDVVQKEWLQLDKVVSISKSADGEEEFLVKWQTLPYDECTWVPRSEIQDLPGFAEKEALYRKYEKGVSVGAPSAERKFEEFKEQPSFLQGENYLYDYQLDGLNWLRYSWHKHLNCILADEMGLGKTAQTIAFVASLAAAGYSPALVVVPLATMGNWEREFSVWAPHLHLVSFLGSPESRKVIRDYELCAVRGKQKVPRFHVMLTTYDMIIGDSPVFKQFDWDLLVIDEGHRLKNNKSRLFHLLKDYVTGHRVLLTGTPLQNNLAELFNLLEFLQLPNFKRLEREEIEKEFESLDKEEKIRKLHQLLRPHFLRRIKKDVLPILPPKAELLVPLSLTGLQKEYYKAILTKNYKILHHGASRPALHNVLMELTKCANHPYLIPDVEPASFASKDEEIKRLISASSKLAFLDRLLKRLKERGHRVLVFSQMTRVLDILEDYLVHVGYVYDRIDGKVAAPDRQPKIDRFNAPGSPVFLMLLSTRACRLGINLATADTVVIYDSDWNPHNDIQAFSRVHRIGQNNKVMIYRLLNKGTVEEGVIRAARKKLVLEHLVVHKMDKELKEGELADLLKIGAEDLFSATAGENDIRYDDAQLEQLLDRSQVTDAPPAGEKEEGQNAYLGSLKEARVWVDQSAPPVRSADDQAKEDFWQRLLAEKAGAVNAAEAAERDALGKGRRIRKQIHYFEEAAVSSSDEIEDEEDASEARKKRQKAKKGQQRADESSGEWGASSASEDEDEEEEGEGDAEDGQPVRRPDANKSPAAKAASQHAMASPQANSHAGALPRPSAAPPQSVAPAPAPVQAMAPKTQSPAPPPTPSQPSSQPQPPAPPQQHAPSQPLPQTLPQPPPPAPSAVAPTTAAVEAHATAAPGSDPGPAKPRRRRRRQQQVPPTPQMQAAALQAVAGNVDPQAAATTLRALTHNAMVMEQALQRMSAQFAAPRSAAQQQQPHPHPRPRLEPSQPPPAVAPPLQRPAELNAYVASLHPGVQDRLWHSMGVAGAAPQPPPAVAAPQPQPQPRQPAVAAPPSDPARQYVYTFADPALAPSHAGAYAQHLSQGLPPPRVDYPRRAHRGGVGRGMTRAPPTPYPPTQPYPPPPNPRQQQPPRAAPPAVAPSAAPAFAPPPLKFTAFEPSVAQVRRR